MENNIKKCLSCDKKITGRSDKKFCDDTCRNQFNNAKNLINSASIKWVNTILKRNRTILAALLGNEEMIKVSMERLRIQNFDFKYHTHLYTTQKGATYTFCYEYGYLILENDKILIVKRNVTD